MDQSMTGGTTAPELNVRAKILQCATELFSERGYAGTSIRQVASEVGVGLPMLYYYFDSKERLYRTVLDHQLRQVHDMLASEASAEPTALVGMERYARTLFDIYTRRLPSLPGLLLQSTALKMPITPTMVMRYKWAVVDPLAEIIAAGVRSGEFRAVDPDTCAEAVVALVLGLTRRRAQGMEKYDENTVVSQVVDIYARGLLRGAKGIRFRSSVAER